MQNVENRKNEEKAVTATIAVSVLLLDYLFVEITKNLIMHGCVWFHKSMDNYKNITFLT